MKISADLERRLLFILHRGFVESRLLANAGMQQQIFDLADALEPIPGWMLTWESRRLDEVRELLRVYETKHPNAFCYSDYLQKFDLPRF